MKLNRIVLEHIDSFPLTVIFCRRASGANDVLHAVREDIAFVQNEGDAAVKALTEKYDKTSLEQFPVQPEEFEEADRNVSESVKHAIRAAAQNILRFHKAQMPPSIEVRTAPGVVCRREWRPIQRVGLYAPGGSAPLFSTVLMLGIPAVLAGCREIVLCTPPTASGAVAPEILFAAKCAGIKNIYKIGGAQAIAAMAVGTESVPNVDKIFGPGNRYVVAAKAIVSQPPYNVPSDLPAGPSELLIIADETAPAEWIAADILSQAEHGEDSQVVLITPSKPFADIVDAMIAKQISSLPRKQYIERALQNSYSLCVPALSDAIALSNRYAPEHLILAIEHADAYASAVLNAGSVFLGARSSIVFGDYSSGTNHTLPTAGAAVATGGLTIESFLKPVLFQTINKQGCDSLVGITKTMARAERLEAHARAAEYRETRND